MLQCPKCGSDNSRIIERNYPRAYECGKCGNIFVKSPQALIDDN